VRVADAADVDELGSVAGGRDAAVGEFEDVRTTWLAGRGGDSPASVSGGRIAEGEVAFDANECAPEARSA
jgi:hypothetical protein